MAWYSENWRYRRALAIDIVGVGAGAPVVVDATWTIPSGWDHFWESVRSDGYDVIAVDADGTTLLNFDITGWSVANRTGTLRIDGYSAPDDDAMCMCWLYYGYASQAASLQAVVAIAAARTIYATQDKPGRQIVRVGPEEYGATVPRAKIVKAATEAINFWWDLSGVTPRLDQKHNGSNLGTEIDYVKFQVLLAAADQAAMYSETAGRFTHPDYVRTRVQAGTSGTDYTASLTVGLTSGEIRNPRALLRVVTPDETP